MTTTIGLQWGVALLALGGAILAAYAAIRLPAHLVHHIPSLWSGGYVTGKIAMEQKGYNAGAVFAICIAFLFQVFATAPLPDGFRAFALGFTVLITAVLVCATAWSRRQIVTVPNHLRRATG